MARALIAVAFVLLGASPAAAAIEGFQSDLDTALAQARRSEKPLVAFFTAAWCEPCQEMKAQVFPDPRVRRALTGFVPVEVDTDTPAGAKAWERFKVSNLPTIVLLRADGTELREARIEGARSAGELVKKLEATHAAFGASPTVPGPQAQAGSGEQAWRPGGWLFGVGGLVVVAGLAGWASRRRARRRGIRATLP